MSKAGRASTAFVIFAILLVAAACGGDDGIPADFVAPESLAEFYDEILAYAYVEDTVLHTTIAWEPEEGEMDGESDSLDISSLGLWIDTPNDTVLFTLGSVTADTLATDGELWATLTVGSHTYVPDDPGEAYKRDSESFCTGSQSAVLSYLLCLFVPGNAIYNEPPTATFDVDASYDGRAALAITYRSIEVLSTTPSETGEAPRPIVIEEMTTVFIDPVSFLPVARTSEQLRDGTVMNSASWTFDHEFIARDELPDDLLDPRFVGYGLRNSSELLDELAKHVPVYWLGEEWDYAGEDAPLVLTEVQVSPDRFSHRRLMYEKSSGEWAFSIFLWTPDEWDEFVQSPAGDFLTASKCIVQDTIAIGEGESQSYKIPPLSEPELPGTDKVACNKSVHELGFGSYRYIVVRQLDDVVIDIRSRRWVPSALARFQEEVRPY